MLSDLEQMHFLLCFKNKNAYGCECIREKSGQFREPPGDRVFRNDRNVQTCTQFAEIPECAEVDVGGVVPLERHLRTARHSAFAGDLHPASPMTEVDNADSGAFADADDLFEQQIGTAGLLKRMAQDRQIK